MLKSVGAEPTEKYGPLLSKNPCKATVQEGGCPVGKSFSLPWFAVEKEISPVTLPSGRQVVMFFSN